MKRNLLTIGHVNPLDLFPRLSFWSIVSILKLILDIGGPGNTSLINGNLFALLVLKNECVIEQALGDETAWNRWVFIRECLALHAFLLVIPHVSNSNHWIAVS